GEEIAPVLERVKNEAGSAGGGEWGRSRRSRMTCCPPGVVSYTCRMPIAPLTIGTTAMMATRMTSRWMSGPPGMDKALLNTAWISNGLMMPIVEVTTIRPTTAATWARYGRNSGTTRRMVLRFTWSGVAGFASAAPDSRRGAVMPPAGAPTGCSTRVRPLRTTSRSASSAPRLPSAGVSTTVGSSLGSSAPGTGRSVRQPGQSGDVTARAASGYPWRRGLALGAGRPPALGVHRLRGEKLLAQLPVAANQAPVGEATNTIGAMQGLGKLTVALMSALPSALAAN